MIVNVNDLEMPTTQTNLFPTDITKYQQIENNLKIAKDSWIASFGFGFAIYHQEDIRKILTDKRWHNALSAFGDINIPDTDENAQHYRERRHKILINLEGDEHQRLRALVSPTFMHKNISYLGPFTNSITNEMIDDLLQKDQFDIQKELFNILPVRVLCKLIGLPEEDMDIFNMWTDAGFNSLSIRTQDQMIEIKKAQVEIDNYVINLIEDRKKNPQNDLITKLLQAENNGDIFSIEEIIMLIEVIISSGIDTTRSQLGLCLAYFANNPDKWNQAINDREVLNKYIEEAMAMDGVIRNLGRMASEDIVYKDILFPKGTLIIPALTVANINEPEYQPLTFGLGIHHCLGMALARLEIQEIFYCLSQKIKEFKIIKIDYKDTTDTIWGIRSLILDNK